MSFGLSNNANTVEKAVLPYVKSLDTVYDSAVEKSKGTLNAFLQYMDKIRASGSFCYEKFLSRYNISHSWKAILSVYLLSSCLSVPVGAKDLEDRMRPAPRDSDCFKKFTPSQIFYLAIDQLVFFKMLTTFTRKDREFLQGIISLVKGIENIKKVSLQVKINGKLEGWSSFSVVLELARSCISFVKSGKKTSQTSYKILGVIDLSCSLFKMLQEIYVRRHTSARQDPLASLRAIKSILDVVSRADLCVIARKCLQLLRVLKKP